MSDELWATVIVGLIGAFFASIAGAAFGGYASDLVARRNDRRLLLKTRWEDQRAGLQAFKAAFGDGVPPPALAGMLRAFGSPLPYRASRVVQKYHRLQRKEAPLDVESMFATMREFEAVLAAMESILADTEQQLGVPPPADATALLTSQREAVEKRWSERERAPAGDPKE